MRNLASIIFATLIFIVVATTARADTIPNFDIERTCQRAGEAAVAPGRNSEGCQRDENTAKDSLNQRWQEFVDADQARCTRVSSMGGPASYVELLTCLDMAKTARSLPKSDALNIPAASR